MWQCVNNENKGNFDGSESIFDWLFFVQSLLKMIDQYVNFHFQQLSNGIIDVFDIL